MNTILTDAHRRGPRHAPDARAGRGHPRVVGRGRDRDRYPALGHHPHRGSGQAGFVRFTRQGQTASLHVLQANVTGAVPIPTGYRPAFHQRVPAVGPTGTFAAASISAATSAFIMNGAYNAAQYATTTSWLCAPTPLPA